MLLDVLAATFVASVLGTVLARPDDPLPSAESILDKVEQRAGDARARAAMKSLLARGTITIQGMPIGGKFELATIGRDRTKIAIIWPGMGSAMTQGTAGNWSWSTDPALGVTIREGDERLGADRMFAIGRRTPWKDLYQKAEAIGRADVGGRPCFELHLAPISTAAATPDKWFVDCETYDLARVDLDLPNPTGGLLPMTWLFDDYREVDGIRFAHRRTQRAAEVELVFTYTEIKPNADVTEEQVSPPPKVQEAMKDPKKRTPSAPEKGGACKVEDVAAQSTLTIRVTIKADEVSKNLAVLFPEIGKYLAEVGATPIGPPFSRYHSITTDTIDLEAGVPVAKAFPGKDRVKSSELPGGKTAITWHVGPYHDLPKSYTVLGDWMKAEKLTARGPFWEIYWTDPGIETDPTKWKTQILWPVE